MAKTFVSGQVLPASDLNTNMEQPATPSTGTRVVAGTTAYSISSASAGVFTVNYSFTFSAVPKVMATVQSSSNIDLCISLNGAATTTSVQFRLCEKNNTSTTVSGNIHWLVIGPP